MNLKPKEELKLPASNYEPIAKLLGELFEAVMRMGAYAATLRQPK